ncbi:class I SAM-dependent rRNA methyltransferase [Deinococcus misasensis]|uniref:class I SAM-dependent rRNA methyltransferase n=1 Tax=Deinococcus misasensis TaxID=392413 RepID=UPI0005525B67|nr:class I SAM-dependent rRNA methyltransferase [Deinococcus misasensis]
MKVRVKSGKEKKLLNHYPFAYSGDLLEVPEVEAGSVVDVHAEGGMFIGRAYFNPTGSIPLRMLTLKRENIDEKFYRARIQAAWDKRKARLPEAEAFRLLHAEADGTPGIVADYFNGILSVQFRNAGVEKHREIILSALKQVTGASAAYERSDTVERNKEGMGQTTGILWGEVPQEVQFTEGGVAFSFRPLDSQKTGFFLDQRDNRHLMASLVKDGDHFLDVYSYTGGFSLHAAKQGAKTLAIDKDATALATLERVAQKNGLDRQVGMRLGDAIKVLSDLVKEKRTFQHAVFDPPTLAKRKDDVPQAKRIFSEGLGHIFKMLSPGGHVLVSTCAHYIRVEDMLDAARLAMADTGRTAEVITVTYQPADHPWMLLVPESLYLKSILLKIE